ncbi:MAG: toprim domain-containing protein [Ruminococcus sp.]|nr:MAG: toprim domain-containing protein [Ruminococcus sp.]
MEDKFNGSGAYKEKTYISTGGAGIDNALEQFCKTHDVKTINICFDDDDAGKCGMENIMKKFREKGYEVNDMRATLAHDYNDELVKFNNDPKFYKEPPITVRPPETVVQKQNDVNIETKTAATENKRNDIMPEITSTEKPEIENSEKPETPKSEKPEIGISDKPEIPNSVKSEIANPVKPEIPPSEKKESSEIQSSVIFGNTGYSKIPDKEHITNIEPSIAVNLFLTAYSMKNIQFFGKNLQKDGLVIAASKDNVDKVNAMIREETALLRKREEQELSVPDIPKEVKSEQTVPNPESRKEKSGSC